MSQTNLTITLTDRQPIAIVKEDWPIIASAKDWDNTYECQANRTWKLIVRQHSDDCRTIVYGIYDTCFQDENGDRAGKYLSDPETPYWKIVDAIKEVGEYLGFERNLIDSCIADLPAEEVV